MRRISFNSPLGILFVRTSPFFLWIAPLRQVSIPRSEFCLFGLRDQPVQNPACRKRFNSPLGILFVRTRNHGAPWGVYLSSFNSPLGILFVRT